MNNKFMNSPVRFLVVIIAKGMDEGVIKSLSKQGISHYSVAYGIGTAKSDTLDCLGLDGPEKAIFLCPVATDNTDAIFSALEGSVLKKNGYGIAFTLPVSAISVNAASEIKKPITTTKKERSKMEYELVAALVDRDMEDEIMHAARAAGASGGTIIRSRAAAGNDDEKFFNITIHAEKEILLIISRTEDKKEIMKAMNDEAKRQDTAITLLSLPVDEVFGLN